MRHILTRTVPATVTGLTTLDRLKTDLGATDTTNDVFYQQVIDICSNEISSYLAQEADEGGDLTIGRETLAETFFGYEGCGELVLGRHPVGDIVSVEEDGTTVLRLLTASDGAMTAGNLNFVSPSAAFDDTYIGKEIVIENAGTGANTPLTSTVVSVTSATEVVLADQCVSTVANAVYTVENPGWSYTVKKSSGLLFKLTAGYPVPWTASKVVVTYSAGWILPGETGRNLPQAIEDACLRFCQVKIDQVQEGDDFAGPLNAVSIDGVGSFNFAGTESYNKGYGLPYEVRNLIARYQNRTFA